MRILAAVALPLLLQLSGFALVILLPSAGGSFVGLLAMVLALLVIPGTTMVTWVRARRMPPMSMLRLMVTALLLAASVPLLLLLFRALESRL